IAWDSFKIARDTTTGSAASPARNPTSFDVHPAVARQGDYVIFTVGNGSHMSIDCKYRLNGKLVVKERWFTTTAAGQFVFQPTATGRYEIVAIKNSEARDWVPASAVLVVE